MSFRVFIVEDQIDPHEAEASFSTDAAVGSNGERLELCGLAQDESDARDQLESLEHTPDGLPDAIVIDDYLPDGAGTTVSRALSLMRWLCVRAIAADVPLGERPRTVLWSACDPSIVYAFCALGGLQYQDKRAPSGRQIPFAAVRRALSGQRWRPDPYPEARHLPERMRHALPFFEHGWPQDRICRHLGLPERGLKEFVSTVKAMPNAPELSGSPNYPSNDSGAVRIAKSHGWVWVPYALHGLIPPGAPLPLVIDPAAHAEALPPA